VAEIHDRNAMADVFHDREIVSDEHVGQTELLLQVLHQVDDLSLGKILNTWTAEGWQLEGIHFAMRAASRRPGMAFITFTREKSVSYLDSQ
jgi:hypothetical protein